MCRQAEHSNLVFALSLPFLVVPFHHCRTFQSWDYDPRVGLIVAGGDSPPSVNMNISRDNGRSIETLTDLPTYSCGSSNNYIKGGCAVIINETTIFYAGGFGEYTCLGIFESVNVQGDPSP